MPIFFRMAYGRFGPRPFFKNSRMRIFVFCFPLEQEANPTHQNVRNGHIYISVMKQHML